MYSKFHQKRKMPQRTTRYRVPDRATSKCESKPSKTRHAARTKYFPEDADQRRRIALWPMLLWTYVLCSWCCPVQEQNQRNTRMFSKRQERWNRNDCNHRLPIYTHLWTNRKQSKNKAIRSSEKNISVFGEPRRCSKTLFLLSLFLLWFISCLRTIFFVIIIMINDKNVQLLL